MGRGIYEQLSNKDEIMIYRRKGAMEILGMKEWTFNNLVSHYDLPSHRKPHDRYKYYSLDEIRQAEARKDEAIIAKRGEGMTVREVMAMFDLTNSAVGRLVKYDDMKRTKPNLVFLYEADEVRAALARKAKRDEEKAAGRLSPRRGRKGTHGGRRTTNDFSTGKGQNPIVLKPEPMKVKKSTGRRYYPAVGRSAIRDFAELSGSNCEALL